ncbi:hypothetical protein BGZ65_004856 [Modicella reniformis]|uniref:Uncharacterized protein n=1 Tax=Modicella reniformis TaxID=1440133 RepID=A0A9P6IK26_9FUNG|nr:hypothetical protein BGZ65_004856 [Modicella reniformis]
MFLYLYSSSQVLNRFQRSSAGISSLVFRVPKDSANQEPHLIVGCEDSGMYETKSMEDSTVQVAREYVGFDLDGPAHARPIAGGPALVGVSKEGGLLRFSGSVARSV